MPPKPRSKSLGAPNAQGVQTVNLSQADWPLAMFAEQRGHLTPQDAYAVGKIIVEELYAGERPEHGRRGRTTFRKIAANLDGKMSAQALYRCAAIYEMCRDLAIAPDWEHVGMSHLSLMLGLPRSQQRRLIQQTERHHWSVERLRADTARLRSARKERKGRRPLLRCVRAIRQLGRFVDGREQLAQDLDRLSELDEASLEQLMELASEVQEQLALVAKELRSELKRR